MTHLQTKQYVTLADSCTVSLMYCRSKMPHLKYCYITPGHRHSLYLMKMTHLQISKETICT